MSQMLNIRDFEKYSSKVLSKSVRDYFSCGANDEQTLGENCNAFSRLRIRPRFLRDVSERHLSTTILGDSVSMPICASPTALQKLAHPLGETATAKACESVGTIMILSTIANSSIEEVSKASPNAIKWFQTYIYKDRNVTQDLVKRAENNGFKAIVLTVDTPILGHRFADTRNKFRLPPNLRFANFDITNFEPESKQKMHSYECPEMNYVLDLLDPSITWKDVEWLKSITSLPIVLKGILTREDALLALKYGVSAILVSNHGARQLDGVPATIEALPEVVNAVQNKCEVYLDGGIRTGTDIIKALALGARAVFIGRPIFWGLSYDGVNGVKEVFRILRKEFDMAMALSGCANLSDIKSNLIVSENYYKSNL